MGKEDEKKKDDEGDERGKMRKRSEYVNRKDIRKRRNIIGYTRRKRNDKNALMEEEMSGERK